MIRKRPWFSRLFRRLIRGHLRSGLDGVWVQHLDRLQAMTAHGAVIVAPTHSSYWDALVALLVEEAVGADAYALMDRANLRRLPFFGWLGAIPVELGAAGANRHALATAASVLDRPGRMLFVFPQGRQRPTHLRPLELRPGLQLVARLARVPVVPVALTYAYRDADRPTAFVDVGLPLVASSDRDAFLGALEAGLVDGLARIDAFVDRGEGAFVALRPGRGSREGVATRLLSAVTGRADGASR